MEEEEEEEESGGRCAAAKELTQGNTFRSSFVTTIISKLNICSHTHTHKCAHTQTEVEEMLLK